MDCPQWRPQLQSAPIGPPWRGDPNVRKSRQKKNVGREKQSRLLCWYIIGTLPILLGLVRETKKIRGSDTVIFRRKYITNPAVAPGDAVVNAAKQLTSALRGIIPPPLVKSGINHLRALTGIFDAKQEGL